jgi:hypothetical protein
MVQRPGRQPQPTGIDGRKGGSDAEGAWDLSDRRQVYLGFVLRFGGRMPSGGGLDARRRDPAMGFLMGMDFAVAKHLAVGPRVALSGWGTDPEAPLDLDLDLGASVRPRVPFWVGDVYLEAYVAVVAGFTAGFVDFDTRSLMPLACSSLAKCEPCRRFCRIQW